MSRIPRNFLIALLLSGFSVGVYILTSAGMGRVGFPLDDAWIHQTYARNLGLRGEWAFIPGQPSAGSTAPLWSGLLAVGYALPFGAYVWTYFLGWTLLLALSLACAWAFKVYAPEKAGWAPWVGLLVIFEWHLVWRLHRAWRLSCSPSRCCSSSPGWLPVRGDGSSSAC
jgi:hypothetical protein